MIFPTDMPSTLKEYGAEQTFEEFFLHLQKNPSHLIEFFEAASFDETWCERHPEEIKKIVLWLHSQSLHRAIPLTFTLRAAIGLRRHQTVLEEFLPLDIQLVLTDKEIQVNSLLLCANSSYFRDRVERECRDKNISTLTLKSIDSSYFQFFLSYIRTGEIPELITASEDQLKKILRYSQEWKFETIISEVQQSLRKYLSKENALEFLLQALKEQWHLIAQEAIDIINENDEGYSLYVKQEERIMLGIAFEAISELGTQMATTLKDWIVSVRCGKNIVKDMSLANIAKNFSKLTEIDLSRTEMAPVFLDRFPPDICSINLMECSWLDREILKDIANWYLEIEDLSFKNNRHLSSTFWSNLIHFKSVKKLNLDGCSQIEDADVLIILKATQYLQTLNLEKCDKLTDKAFFELAKRGEKLENLVLARTKVGDRALVEIAIHCHSLLSIDLSDCDDITERGVIELLKNLKELRHINLDHTSLSPNFIFLTQKGKEKIY